MNKIEELISALAACSTVCPPDEYQMRHNRLIRLMAEYLVEEDLMLQEGEIE